MLKEFLSLLSCLLNVLTFGQREMTYSAASWELSHFGTTERDRRRGYTRVQFVNWLNRKLTGEEDHCRKAWDDHLTFWRQRIQMADNIKQQGAP